MYEISVKLASEPKTSLLWFKKFLVGKNYEAKLELENVGKKDFPGGKAKIQIIYANRQSQNIVLPVPKIKKDEKKETKIFTKTAMGKGYALFNGEIIATDGKPTHLIRGGERLLENASLGEILVKTHADVYPFYALLVSTITLVVVIVFSLIQVLG